MADTNNTQNIENNTTNPIENPVETEGANQTSQRKIRKSTLFITIIFPLLIIGMIVFAVIKIRLMLNPITLDSTITEDDIANYSDNYDVMVPLTDENGFLVRQDVKKIVIFGNYPFAEDATATDGMAALLANATGAEIINCAIEGSRLGCTSPEMPSTSGYPMDIYTPYYLTALMSYKNEIYDEFNACGALLGDNKPSNADAVIDTLYKLDPSEIDVFVYMYDFEDYWATQRCVDSYNEYSIDTVCGNIISSFRMIKMQYHDNRIIFMSPYFNLYENEDGSMDSTQFHKTIHGDTTTYFYQIGDAVNKTTEASFVDNLFGTITEANYSAYLSDNRHLNQSGREKLIERLVYAIHYYDEKR